MSETNKIRTWSIATSHSTSGSFSQIVSGPRITDDFVDVVELKTMRKLVDNIINVSYSFSGCLSRLSDAGVAGKDEYKHLIKLFEKYLCEYKSIGRENGIFGKRFSVSEWDIKDSLYNGGAVANILAKEGAPIKSGKVAPGFTMKSSFDLEHSTIHFEFEKTDVNE